MKLSKFCRYIRENVVCVQQTVACKMGDYLQYETISNLTGCKHFSGKSSEFKMNFEKGVERKGNKGNVFQ